MDLNMLLMKLGIIIMFYFQPVFMAKDSMEFSKYTFAWEDAESRCLRQGNILVPGRRYRAKMIKKLMTKENVDAVWLYGWRAVSDISPDSGGKLKTLKVDFSRPQSKELKLVCKMDSMFYDPLYTAASTDLARGVCARDGAELADVTTEGDVKRISEKIVVDKPHWINSISSGGSKIKQCLVAQMVADDLKYSYEDCSKEYNFICVKGDDIISSFSPLISLKMARFEEFEEEIEKHEQSMMSSSEMFDLFPSTDIPFDMFSTNIPDIETSSVQPKMMSSSEVTSSVTSIDTPSSANLSTIVTSHAKPKPTSVEVSSSEELVVDTSTVTIAKETSEMLYTISATSVLVIPTITQVSQSDATSSSSLRMDASTIVDTTVSSSILAYTETLYSSEIFSEQAKITSVTESIPMISALTSDKIAEESSHITTAVTKSSSIDEFYSESAFVDKMESEIISSTQKDSSEVFPTSTMEMSKYLQTSDKFDSTGYAVDIEKALGTLQSTQTVPVQSSSISSKDYFDTKQDELESEYTSIVPFVTGELLVSASKSQHPDIIMEPTSTQQLVPADVSSYKLETESSKSLDTSEESDIFSMPIVATSSVNVGIKLSESPITQSTSSEFAPLIVTSTQDITYTDNTIVPNYLPESSKLLVSSKVLTTSDSGKMSYDCTVVDSTSVCIDAFSSTYITNYPDSSISEYQTQWDAYDVTEAPILLPSSSSLLPSSLSSSPLSASFSSLPSHSLPTSSLIFIDMDKNTERSKTDILSSATGTVDPKSSMYGYDSTTPDHTDNDNGYDDDIYDNKAFSPSSTTATVVEPSSMYDYDFKYGYGDTTPDQTKDRSDHDATPKYTIHTDNPIIDMLNETDNVDEEIPGSIDKGDMGDEDNDAGNVSADTGEIVEKKNEDEDGGIEAGLWVAFAILITLVLIALILAAYLYRKRKLQKSKDITAAPPAAAGETVELRDSRSPSRENGKPRDLATYKDPAYDI